MARLDLIHNSVKNALIKDGWQITDDPFKIEYEEVKLYADLAAERPFAAMRGNQKIVVEAKASRENRIFVNLSRLWDNIISIADFFRLSNLREAYFWR
ncbi:MAG TPA: element excision factor XisH family protein [Pyrinomonadaceae bacterium]|jgi:hypothetical protein